ASRTTMLRLVVISCLVAFALAAPGRTPAVQWSSDCGYSIYNDTDHTLQIVGGVPARPGEFPWQAEFLNTKKGTLCGGFLINSEWVLTAAHCINNANGDRATDYLVSLGLHDRTDATGALEIVPLGGVMHELYDDFNILNDIMLVQLPAGAIPSFSDTIRPVCKPSASNTYAGQVGTVSGWGTTSAGGSISNILLYANLDIITNAACDSAYPNEDIFDYNMCAARDGKDSCQGDSGGPLSVWNPNTQLYEGAGIVSWGYGCADPLYPGVYTRVSYYEAWIDNIITTYAGQQLNSYIRG
ncbi:unnamed protein product, partial [Owenia fusiformis]